MRFVGEDLKANSDVAKVLKGGGVSTEVVGPYCGGRGPGILCIL